MKNFIIRIRLSLTVFFFVTAFFLNGCSVFSSIGNTISLGYENMVSYFNGYYNARNLFNDAEDEIKTAALLARGKADSSGQANQIPGTAKQKLGQVIDKCSNILAFHPSSSLVDNSLLLIGKSFFYQMEYLKAERKFAELLSQFPNSSLALEAQLWYARTEEKLGKLDDGIRLSDATVLAAQTSHENEIETQAHQLLAVIYHRMNQTDKSIAEYERAISISTDDVAKGNAQMNLGDIYFADGQYKKAAEVYLKTEDYTSDIYSNYYSKLQASIAYRKIGEQKKGLALVNAMIDDFRNKEYLAAILFERANNYAASGRRDEAIDEYIFVDTSYAHTEFAVRSAYQLGVIFEKELGLYGRALKYYTEVNTATVPSIVADGRRKFTALTRYFDARRRLYNADSLLFVLSDTTHKIIPDTLNTIAADSAHQKPAQVNTPFVNSNIDSLKAKNLVLDTAHQKPAQVNTPFVNSNIDSLKAKNLVLDTTHQKPAQVNTPFVNSNIDSLKAKNLVLDTTHQKPVQVAVKPALPSADSLRILKSIAAQELGDIFYSEVVEPDSAFFWYNQSLLWNYNHSQSPRILYILSELSRTNPEKKFPAPEEYHSRLDHDFPESIYAEEARRFLRKASPVMKTDSASEYYAQSEKQVDAKQYEKAIGTLRFIIQSFPTSPFAAKSEYAIGWIMENSLAQPDSAIIQYKRVIKNHKGTTYALAASNRALEIPRTDTIKTDTVNRKNKAQLPKSSKPDTVQVKTTGLIKDTVKQRPILSPDELKGKQRLNPAVNRSLEVQQSDTLKTDTANANIRQQIQKSFSPDSVQRSATGLEKDSVKQLPISPRSDIENGQEKRTPSRPKILD